MAKIKRFTVPFWFVALLIAFVGLFIFAYQQIYLTPFDYRYSKDLYDHAQWRIARSTRSIGDDLLYQVAGVELLQKFNFFEIAPEVPPLGKYLYGASIQWFGNALWANLPVFGLVLWLFYLISFEVLKNRNRAQFATLLFLLQPVLFRQLTTTMLDLPQLSSLLLHVYGLLKLTSAKRHQLWYLFLAGIGAGFFISVKIGFLILVIFAVDFYFLIKSKKVKYFFLIPAIAGLTYLAAYLPYFWQGNGLLSFIRSQLWILHFYTSSKVVVNHVLVLISLFTGWYRGWTENAAWTRSDHWSLTWPFLGLAFAVIFYQKWRRHEFGKITASNYLMLQSLGLLLVYLFIPFWTRYMLLVIPLIIIVVFAETKIAKTWPGILLAVLLLVQLPSGLMANPENAVIHAQELWTRGLYQDLYSYLNFNQQPPPERFAFWRRAQRLERQLTLTNRWVKLRLGTHNWLNTRIPLKITLTYETELGPINHQAQTDLIKKNNQWLIRWRPDLFLPKYTKSSVIRTRIDSAQGGVLRTAGNAVLSEYKERPFFYVTPNKIEDEQGLLRQLFNLTGMARWQIEQIYKSNHQSDWPAPIGFLKPALDLGIIDRTKFEPGVSYQNRGTRVYNILDFLDKINSIQKYERAYGQRLAAVNGGEITLVLTNGKTIRLLRQTAKDGQDVVLTDAESKIFIN